ncbi:MAG: SDR family NAD(P)-dependent oxidoreductase [Bacteroidota bacterium]
MSEKPLLYTLITGASRGIGLALARECASRGMNLVLVALPGEDLAGICTEISAAHKVDARFLEMDLSIPNAADQVYEWVLEEGLTVNFLINNAGFGTLGTLLESDLMVHRKMMRLNMDTPYNLICLFLPMLFAQKNGYLLNVASQAAFFPIPWKATYGASKVFLQHISCALQYEMKDTHVNVSCLCPSGVITTPEVRARIEAAGMWSRWAALEPEYVARISIDATIRGKRMIVPGWVNKLVHFLSRVFLMKWSMTMAANRFSREVDVDAEQKAPV